MRSSSIANRSPAPHRVEHVRRPASPFEQHSGELHRRTDEQLLVAALQELSSRPACVGAARGSASTDKRSGSGTRSDEPQEPRLDRRVFPGPRGAEDQQRPALVRDRVTLDSKHVDPAAMPTSDSIGPTMTSTRRHSTRTGSASAAGRSWGSADARAAPEHRGARARDRYAGKRRRPHAGDRSGRRERGLRRARRGCSGGGLLHARSPRSAARSPSAAAADAW